MRRSGVLNDPIKPPKGFNDEYDTHNFIDAAPQSWIEGEAKKSGDEFVAKSPRKGNLISFR